MKNQNYHERANQPQYLLVPEEMLQEILDKQNQILEILSPKNTKIDIEPLGDYITEKEAKKLFGKGRTWFWNKRQEGLHNEKVGGTVYYLKKDLLNLIKNATDEE